MARQDIYGKGMIGRTFFMSFYPDRDQLTGAEVIEALDLYALHLAEANFTGISRLRRSLLDIPSLVQFEGNIVGVGFEPGRSEVRIKSDAGMPSLDATDEQVEAVLQMRRTRIRALGVRDGKRFRLFRIARARDPQFKVTPEAIEEHLFKRWAGVFEVLSKA